LIIKYNYHIVDVRTVKDRDKILVHVVMFLSFGISLLGCSRYFDHLLLLLLC
jgi:hypothetical protein